MTLFSGVHAWPLEVSDAERRLTGALRPAADDGQSANGPLAVAEQATRNIRSAPLFLLIRRKQPCIRANTVQSAVNQS